jgi:hypothetical protein
VVTDPDDYSGGYNGAANMVDGYYVKWAVNDDLTFKAGEWGLGFGRAIGVDGRGGNNVGVTYGLNAVDIEFWIGKIFEDDDFTVGPPAGDDTDDQDNEDMQLKVSVKDAGPLTKLDLTYLANTNDVDDESATFMGIDLAFPAGPVDLGIEYGSQGGDQEGGYYLIAIGLDELVGFDLGLDYFASDAEFGAEFGEDYDQTYLMSDTSDITYIRLTASYPVNDDLTVGAKMVTSVEDDAGNDLGTAMDVYANYKLADNVSSSFTYGSISAGDEAVDAQGTSISDDLGDKTGMRARITFKF